MSTRLLLEVLDSSYGDVAVEAAAAAPSGVDVVARGSAGRRTDGVLVQYATITGQVLDQNPSWRVVGRYGVGIDTIDIDACTARGIAVVNVPDYCEEEVATHAAALALSSVRRVVEADRLVRSGGWPAWRTLTPIPALSEATLALIGLGRIGRETIRLLRPFFGRIIAYDPYSDPLDDVESVSLDEALARGDIVSLHCPLTSATIHIIDARALKLMKPSAHLINVSRGGLIDGPALAAALHSGEIAGAAIDVLEREPPDEDDALLGAPRLIVTNHLAWYSERSEPRLRHLLAERCAAVLSGRDAPSIVNRKALAERASTVD